MIWFSPVKLFVLRVASVMAEGFYEEIADSKIDKFIMSLNAARHNEIHPIYHVDPEEELLITFEDDNLIQEEIPTPAIAKISTAKGNEGTPHFIDTDTNTPNFNARLSLNELEEFIITRKYNENVSKRNYETLHPKAIPPLESSNNIYGIFPTSLRCSASSIDFHGDKYDCSNNNQDKNLRMIFMNFY